MSKALLLLKWDAFVVSIMSIIYGGQLIGSPDLLNNHKAYASISYLLDSQMFGILFIILGVLKIYSVFKNNFKAKTLSVSLLGGLWMFFFIGFVYSPVENSLWVLPLSMFLLCIGISLKEWSK